MKYLNFICYSLLLMLLFNTSSLYAAPPLTDHTTHTPLSLMPEPLSGSRDTLKLAATWWLPDWQNNQNSRGSTDDGGGDIVKDDSDCMKHYNLYATCPSPKLSTGVVHPVAGMTCQKSCYCPSEYKYTSSNCSGNYTVSGGSCDGKYNDCVCKSEFKYNSSNCSGENQPSGTSCGGNYNGCTIRPECTVSSKDCTYGCAGYNSCDRCTSCKSNPDCDVSDKSCTYGCASYNSCSKCTSCKGNPDCDVTSKSCTYGCASTNSCGICTSCSGNPDCDVSSLSCSNGCLTYNSCSKCTECKSEPACSDTCPSYTKSSSSSCLYGYDSCYDTCYGRTWYKCNDAPSDPCSGVSCGSNAYCSGGSCYCNSGYTGNANSGCTKVDTCVSGGNSSCSGQTSSCSSSQVQTASCKDCSGTMHYTCRAKTCAEQGKKDCNGSCISTSECCGGCQSGYSCKNGSCEKDHTHSYSCPSGYSASTCSSNYIQTGTTAKVCSCGATSGTCYKCKNPCDNYSCPANASCTSPGGKPQCTCSSGYNPQPSGGVCTCRTDPTYFRCNGGSIVLNEDLDSWAWSCYRGYRVIMASPCAKCVVCN
mgnify:FL=1